MENVRIQSHYRSTFKVLNATRFIGVYTVLHIVLHCLNTDITMVTLLEHFYEMFFNCHSVIYYYNKTAPSVILVHMNIQGKSDTILFSVKILPAILSLLFGNFIYPKNNTEHN